MSLPLTVRVYASRRCKLLMCSVSGVTPQIHVNSVLGGQLPQLNLMFLYFWGVTPQTRLDCTYLSLSTLDLTFLSDFNLVF